MTRASLWARHRGIAIGIAADYRIPGMDPDDVRQEALVALWEATLKHDPQRGTFPAWARTVIHGRLVDLLRETSRDKRRALNDATHVQLQFAAPTDVAGTVEARDRLREGIKQGAQIADRRERWRKTKRKQRAAV